MIIKIGITGHRQLEDPAKVRTEIEKYIKLIKGLNEDKEFIAYSSIAAGSDSVFAEAALKLGGTLKVVLPFDAGTYVASDFNEDEKKTFNELLKHDPATEPVTKAIPLTQEQKNDAYLKAGETIVDACDYIIAVWDGEPAQGKGGTAEVVNYAHNQTKAVHHIKHYRSDLSRSFHLYDKKAVASKSWYEFLWKTSICLSIAAALTLAAYISFSLEKSKVVLASIEFGAVAIAVFIILKLRRGAFNKNRIALRRTAERLRVMEKFHKSCIPFMKIESFIGLAPDVIELENKYSNFHYADPVFSENSAALLSLCTEQKNYHSTNRPEVKDKFFDLIEWAKFPLLMLFSIGVTAHFISVLIPRGIVEHVLHVGGFALSLSMPPLYAAGEGYIFFKEYHKLQNDSKNMKQFFMEIEDEINGIDVNVANKFDLLKNYATQILKAMDDDTKEWEELVVHKSAPGF